MESDTPQRPTLSIRAESLTKLGLSIAGLAYILGFAVVALHLAQYGISPLNLRGANASPIHTQKGRRRHPHIHANRVVITRALPPYLPRIQLRELWSHPSTGGEKVFP
jgi:hypothetical protein